MKKIFPKKFTLINKATILLNRVRFPMRAGIWQRQFYLIQHPVYSMTGKRLREQNSPNLVSKDEVQLQQFSHFRQLVHLLQKNKNIPNKNFSALLITGKTQLYKLGTLMISIKLVYYALPYIMLYELLMMVN